MHTIYLYLNIYFQRISIYINMRLRCVNSNNLMIPLPLLMSQFTVPALLERAWKCKIVTRKCSRFIILHVAAAAANSMQNGAKMENEK